MQNSGIYILNPYGKPKQPQVLSTRTSLIINSFGEQLFVSQKNSSFDSRYKFTVKELDNELRSNRRTPLKLITDVRQTNYTYFGARDYDSDGSFWLSVDPMSDLYPSTSPYMYVKGNPIKLIDPNGMYSRESKANKAHEKAEKKYGSENVGRVYYDKNRKEYGFRMSKTKFQQYNTDQSSNTVANGVNIEADGGVEIFNKSSYRNYEAYGFDAGLNGFERSMMPFIMLAGVSGSYCNDFFGEPSSTSSSTQEMTNYWATNITLSIAIGGLGRVKMPGGEKNRPTGNIRQNKQFSQIAREFNLTKVEQESLHRAIQGEDFGFQELRQFTKEFFNK